MVASPESANHHDAPRAGVARGAIWTLISVDLLARVSYGFARTPVLPLYAAHLGAGPEMIGFIGAAATITGVVMKLPAGAISDAIGRRPLLFAGLFVFATGPVGYLLVRGVWGLAGIRFYHGFATAIYGPVAMAAVASLAKSRKGEYLSWLSNSKIAGKLLGALLGGLVLSLAFSGAGAGIATHLKNAFAAKHFSVSGLTTGAFHLAYLVCAGLGVCAFVLGLFVLGRVDEPGVERKRTFRAVGVKIASGVREIASDARVLLASGSEGVQNLTVGVIEQFLPIYAVAVAGLSPLLAGLLYGGQMLTAIFAKPVFGRWSDRKGRKTVIVWGLFLCALSFAAIPWVRGFFPLFGLCLVFGLGEALVTSSSAAFVGDLCRERSLGAAMGMFGTVKDVGHALGPILGGAILVGAAGASGIEVAPAPYRIAFGAIAFALVAYAVVFGVKVEGAKGR